LIDPRAPKTSEAARRRAVDEFVDQLEKISLSVHVKEVWKQPDFNVTTISTKSPSEGYPSESLAVKHRHSLWYPPKEALDIEKRKKKRERGSMKVLVSKKRKNGHMNAHEKQ